MYINNRIYISKYKYGYNLIYYMFIDHNVIIDINPETMKVHYNINMMVIVWYMGLNEVTDIRPQ